MGKIKPVLNTLQKLQRIAGQLNSRIDKNKLRFNFSQDHYYLVYDFNTRSITQLTDRSAFKIQGVVYCLDPKFKETALRWISQEELEGYLRDD